MNYPKNLLMRLLGNLLRPRRENEPGISPGSSLTGAGQRVMIPLPNLAIWRSGPRHFGSAVSHQHNTTSAVA